MTSDLSALRVMRRPEVEHVTGLSRASLYRLIGKGHFPNPVKLSSNSVGWREADIREWLESREPAVGPALTRAGRHEDIGGAA